jgi:hypothetical protein
VAAQVVASRVVLSSTELVISDNCNCAHTRVQANNLCVWVQPPGAFTIIEGIFVSFIRNCSFHV